MLKSFFVALFMIFLIGFVIATIVLVVYFTVFNKDSSKSDVAKTPSTTSVTLDAPSALSYAPDTSASSATNSSASKLSAASAPAVDTYAETCKSKYATLQPKLSDFTAATEAQRYDMVPTICALEVDVLASCDPTKSTSTDVADIHSKIDNTDLFNNYCPDASIITDRANYLTEYNRIKPLTNPDIQVFCNDAQKVINGTKIPAVANAIKNDPMYQKYCSKCTPTANGGVSCVVDCQVSDWSPWSSCSASCGTGTQTRTRTVTVPGQNSQCPTLTDTQTCNTQPCAANCVMSDWSPWSTCSQPCGGGMSTRTRTIISPAQAGGTPCGALTDSQLCNTAPCQGIPQATAIDLFQKSGVRNPNGWQVYYQPITPSQIKLDTTTNTAQFYNIYEAACLNGTCYNNNGSNLLCPTVKYGQDLNGNWVITANNVSPNTVCH